MRSVSFLPRYQITLTSLSAEVSALATPLCLCCSVCTAAFLRVKLLLCTSILPLALL